MSKLSFACAGTFLSALIGFPSIAPAQGTVRELVCRGAPDIDLRFDKDPSPLSPNMFRFVLYYKPGQQPVGSEYENLAPGACSWNSANDSSIPVEPGVVWFDVERDFLGGGPLPDTSVKAAELYPDRTTVPRYLKDPSHYWKFYVDENNLSLSNWAAKYYPRQPVIAVDSGGPAGKSTDRAGTSTRGTGSLRDDNPTLDATRIPITFHEVVRKPTQYWLRFGARANSGVIAEYGIAPPIRKNGRLTFHQPYRWPVRVQSESGFAAEYSTAPVRGLVHGKKYYFVIYVPAGGRGIPAQEYSGDFWTLANHITVRFTRIDVLNDSDKMDSGEIAFGYYLAPGDQTSFGPCNPPDVCYIQHSAEHWETGSQNPIDVTLSRRITTSSVRIWVAGSDSDNDFTHTRSYTVPWTARGGSGTNFDRNNARVQLNMVPVVDQMTYSIAFKLRSFDGHVLMYEVHGVAESVWK